MLKNMMVTVTEQQQDAFMLKSRRTAHSEFVVGCQISFFLPFRLWEWSLPGARCFSGLVTVPWTRAVEGGLWYLPLPVGVGKGSALFCQTLTSADSTCLAWLCRDPNTLGHMRLSGVYDSAGYWGPAALFMVEALLEVLYSEAKTKTMVL